MPKFQQRKDHNYNRIKVNNNFCKKKFNQINYKSFHNIEESIQTSKWMKVTCLTSSENCCNDIVHEIEDLCERFTNRRVQLKACNVVFNNELLEFYINMKKSDIDYVIQNVHKIRHYRLKCYKNEDVHVPYEIPANWLDVLKQALEVRYKINPTNNEAELNLSYFSEDKILLENNLVLNFTSSRVFECVLNILKKELKELAKLDLSNNSLSNLCKLKSFLINVRIIRLDISNNNLITLSDLSPLENSTIVELSITGNHFRKCSSQELRKEIRRILPNLKILNGIKMEDSVVIAGETLKSSKMLPSVLKSSVDNDALNFVMNYFSKFDSKTRDELCDFYSSDSVLTMGTYGDTLAYYKLNNSNFYLSRDNLEQRTENIKRGKAQILGTFVNFPQTKHISETLNVETVSANNSFLIIVVMGVFVEIPSNKITYRVREFSRLMVIVQGGVILQEFIQLMPNDSSLYHRHKTSIESVKEQMDFAKSHRDLEKLSWQQIEVVKQFKTFSRMNVPTCLRFLTSFNGLEAASEEFKKLQSQGAIPVEAFQDE